MEDLKVEIDKKIMSFRYLQVINSQTDIFFFYLVNASEIFPNLTVQNVITQKSKYCNSLIKQQRSLLLSASHSLVLLVRPVVLISCSCFLIQFLIEWSLFQFTIEERSKMQEEKNKTVKMKKYTKNE